MPIESCVVFDAGLSGDSPMHPGAIFSPVGKSFDAVYASWRAIRNESPVFYWSEQGIWVVTRHEDINRILHDESFTLEGILTSLNRDPEAMRIIRSGIDYNTTEHIQNTDEKKHAKFRSILLKILSPRRFREMEPFVRSTTIKLITNFIQRGRCEFVGEFAYLLPSLTVLNLIGFREDEEDMRQIQRWSDDTFRMWLAPLTPEQQRVCARHTVEFQEYILRKLAARRRDPRDDVMTALLQAVDSGEADLTEAEMVVMFTMNIIGGGHETTKGQLALAFYDLLVERGRWEEVLNHPDRLDETVEELIRYDPVVMMWYRTASNDATVGGVQIPAGSRILMALGAANHDDRKFDRADEFCPHRGVRSGQITFSAGRHVCLGAALARMELRIAIEEFAKRIPSLRLAENYTVQYEPILVTRVIPKLDLEWDAH
jgi:cytochrome P450